MKIYYDLNKIVSTFLVIILCVFITFRSGNDFYDVNNYISMFNEVSSGTLANAEFTFSLISKISQFFGTDYYGVFLCYSLISIFGKVYFLNRHIEYRWLGIILYVFSYFVLYEFVQMRAATGLGLFLIFVSLYIRGEKLLYCIIFLCLSIAFHYSMIVLLPSLLIVRFLASPYNNRYALLGGVSALTTIVSIYLLINFSLKIPSVITLLNNPRLFSFIPERIFQGYFVLVGNMSPPSSKMIFSSFLSLIVSVLVFLKYIPNNRLHIFSALTVMLGSWVYLFLGSFGVVADRLAELCMIFIIVVLDGLLRKKLVMGLFFYSIILLIYSYNLVFRATYYSIF
ncbi:EpsG family protein [Vibrio tasmaniensis]|uniref:EpsG family protein n=1 Tax=Vibrio tasmaniensis TaxID=212663 RepID=UPI00107FE8AC|nr:EpsG family protein [Vibrio tasmaniensis]